MIICDFPLYDGRDFCDLYSFPDLPLTNQMNAEVVPLSESEISSTPIETQEKTTLGQLLKTYRAQAALTQSVLAELSGVKFHKISLYELDMRIPAEDEVKLLTPALKLPKDFSQLVHDARVERSHLPSTLRKLRSAKSLTQVQLSRLSGIDYRLISEAELHNRPLNIEQARALAPYLDTTADVLLESMPQGLQRPKRKVKVFPVTAFKEARLRKNLTQKSLAKITGISQRTIILLDRGMGTCTPLQAEVLSAFLDISQAELKTYA